MSSEQTFLQFAVELVASPKHHERQEGHHIFEDWQQARSRMWSELVAKLAHFQQLPYKLLQLAHNDPQKVTLGAQEALRLWDAGGSGVQHRQSRRFLDESWQGGESDPSLRHLVLRLAQGESVMASADFAPLVNWVARFACIRLCERSVESIHSLMTRSLKRAPHAGTAYLSFELRFAHFWESMMADARVTRLVVLVVEGDQ